MIGKTLVSMRHILMIGGVLSLLVFQSCKDNEIGNEPFALDVGNSEIPYLIIDTRGNTILFEPKVPALLQVYDGKTLVQAQEIGIEYRGKTSYRLSHKKGFNLETWDVAGEGVDVSFFGFPEEEDWRLIGHIVNLTDKYMFDKSLMYNYVGYELARRIGRYASLCKFVELQLNDEYLGVYLFAEKLKRDKNRIDIKSLNESATNITGGYILTIDKTSVGDAGIGKPLSYFDNNWDDDARYNNINSFRSEYDIFGSVLNFPPFAAPYHANQYLETYFLYEYPKAEDITFQQQEYIADYINQFETSLLINDFQVNDPAYTDFIDVSSFVDYFIINELARNVDAYRLSTYLQKDRDGKLAMGPVWDMDIGFDNGDRIPMDDWVINYNNHVSRDPWMMPFWWPKLLQYQQFRTAVKQRWSALRADQLGDGRLLQLVDETASLLKENGAVDRNYEKWDQWIGVDYDASVSDLRNFLLQRAAWMDGVISSF